MKTIKKLTPTELIEKWRPILFPSDIPSEYILNVAYYAENMTIIETMDYTSNLQGYIYDTPKTTKPYQPLLPLAIKIIAEIDDLSKVYFMEGPMGDILGRNVQAGTLEFTFPLSVSDMQYLQITQMFDDFEYNIFEKRIVDEISDRLNKEINDEKTLCIYNICQSIKVIGEEGDKMPKLIVHSRFTAIDLDIDE